MKINFVCNTNLYHKIGFTFVDILHEIIIFTFNSHRIHFVHAFALMFFIVFYLEINIKIINPLMPELFFTTILCLIIVNGKNQR